MHKLLIIARKIALGAATGAFLGFDIGFIGYACADMAADSATAAVGKEMTSVADASWLYWPAVVGAVLGVLVCVILMLVTGVQASRTQESAPQDTSREQDNFALRAQRLYVAQKFGEARTYLEHDGAVRDLGPVTGNLLAAVEAQGLPGGQKVSLSK